MPADLPFFLGLMEHLAARGINCPLPVKNRVGQRPRPPCRPAGGDRHVSLDGLWVRRPRAEHCAAVGKALAELHLAGRRIFPHPPQCPVCRGLAAAVRDVRRPRRQGRAAARRGDCARARSSSSPAGRVTCRRASSTPISFPTMSSSSTTRLSGLIDFYFACNDMLAYDVAVCINAWCFEPDVSLNVTKARGLLANYAAVRPLSPDETAALPLLCRGAALRFLLTRLYDWLTVPDGALVGEEGSARILQEAPLPSQRRRCRGLRP